MPVKNRAARKLPFLKRLFESEASSRSKDENRMEWLYFESLRLAKLTPKEKANHEIDLPLAEAGAHHWLIGKGPRPDVWVFLLRSSSLKRANAFVQVKDGEGVTAKSLLVWHPSRRVHSWDPELPEKELIAQFKREIKKGKEAINRSRATGGGKHRSINRMEEALQFYKKWEQSKGQLLYKTIGYEAKTFGPIPDGAQLDKIVADRGQKLMDLARRMIATAKAGPHRWMKTFPVH